MTNRQTMPLRYNKITAMICRRKAERDDQVNAVVFDLELVKRFRKGQPSEIVEIGACKVDPVSRKIIDQFQIYISPRKGYIAKSTRSFINMTREDMLNAVPFHEGIRQFVDWLGDDYYLCSWGKDDRIHLIDECLRKKVDLSWLVNYNDIQKQIGALLREDNKNQLGLQNALELAGIEPVGLAHRGIDDAINTARLLIHMLDQVQLQRNTVTEKEIEQYRQKQIRKRQERRKSSKSSNKSTKSKTISPAASPTLPEETSAPESTTSSSSAAPSEAPSAAGSATRPLDQARNITSPSDSSPET